MTSERLCAPQVGLIPVGQFSLCCDSVLAPLYICMTNVHQRIVPKSRGIALDIWYLSALTAGFRWYEKQLDRPMYKEDEG